MNQSPNIEALLANSYQEGTNAFKSKNWLQAVKWLEPVYQEAPDYEKVSTYYFYAAGMLAYESRHWKEALKNLQAVQEKDPGFEGCSDLMGVVRQRQLAEDICDQALRLVGEQRHIPPEEQKWDQIALLLTEANELDPEHEKIPAKLDEIKIYQTAQELFIASSKDLQERQYKEAYEKLNRIDDNYKDFCPLLDSKHEEASRGIPLQELYDKGLDAMSAGDWRLAAWRFQRLYDKDPDYLNVQQLLNQANNFVEELLTQSGNSEIQPQSVPTLESEKPIWGRQEFWVAVTAIATVALVLVGVLSNIGRSPVYSPTLADMVGENATIAANTTRTVLPAETATAAANATGTAMSVGSAMAVANATGTAMAMDSATMAAANATGTAIGADRATVAVNATGTAIVVEIATVAANATETAIAAESATAAANATEIVVAAKNATATASAPTPTFIPTPTSHLLPAPVLLSPENGGEAIDLRPNLVWRWDGNLDADYYYEVIIWFNHPDYPDPIDVGWTRATCYTYDHIKEGESWELRWTVGVVKGIPTKEKDWSPTERCDRVWDPVEPHDYVSAQSEIWSHFVKVSPPASPPPPTSKPKPEPTQKSGGGDD